MREVVFVDGSALVMGSTAENPHDRSPHLTGEGADACAPASQQEYAKAVADGQIGPELVTVSMRSAEQGHGLATIDQPPRPDTSLEGLATLMTPFRPRGNVTAGNAAGPDDGGWPSWASRRSTASRASSTPTSPASTPVTRR